MSDPKPIAPTAAAVHAQKRALEQMVYHAVMEFSPWPMAEVEGAAHLVHAINPAFCALLEKTQEEVLGKPLSQLFSEDHATQELLERVLSTGEASTFVETARNTPGPIYWSYTCWPVQAKDARHVGLMIQVTEPSKDDQQTKDMNEALLISSIHQHELTEGADRRNTRLREEIVERDVAATSLQAVAIELADTDRRKSEFLATLAHELRNPLAPLVSGLEIVSLPDCDPGTVERVHAMMGRQLQHMVGLIDDLMDLSRVSRGIVNIRKVHLDLRKVLTEAVETVRSRCDTLEHKLVVDLP
ncbi:MAG: histidine kinase dimerization/phospho-acceptor domain-containing protein, partial [Flavobacteriales bacterium]